LYLKVFCKIFLIFISFYSIALAQSFSLASAPEYCVAVFPCPVLNSPDFKVVFGGQDGKSVRLDKKGLIRELEFIAFAGTPFEIISKIDQPSHSILQVTASDYPSKIPLYIDSRFVVFKKARPPDRVKGLLPVDEIIKSLKAMETSPYMWGGNYCDGIDQMMQFYPPSGTIPPKTLSLWRLEGVDCSGLIYQTSEGYTPRNTSSMLGYGKGLKISGLSAEEICRKVKPLDLIVWPGHVVIVIDNDTVIESLHPYGVVKTSLFSRLKSIMSEKSPVDKWDLRHNKSFVIRRWHGDF
jgi:hypothetical protein